MQLNLAYEALLSYFDDFTVTTFKIRAVLGIFGFLTYFSLSILS
jgi:hypothetical protein